MRDPAPPNASNPADPGASGAPVVSIPDRRRIDSDVRAFLRNPSTPWIVFDQDVRPPSQLAVGEVLPVALSSIIPDHGFFPATAIIDAQAHATPLEPSSLAVASDLADDAPVEDAGSPTLPRRGLSRRVLGAAIGGAAMLMTVALGLVALSPRPAPASAPAAGKGSPVGGDLVPLDLDVKVSVAAPVPAGPAAAPTTAPESRPFAQRFGKLSIVGDARGRDVFLDGKRLLGKGARSFTVNCGTHAISIGTRTDAHVMDVPCNAELTVGK